MSSSLKELNKFRKWAIYSHLNKHTSTSYPHLFLCVLVILDRYAEDATYLAKTVSSPIFDIKLWELHPKGEGFDSLSLQVHGGIPAFGQ